MTRLDSSSREALVAYRIQRSKETYQDALRDFEAGSFNSSMNRLYYACFYGVLALLVKNGIETKSHEGVKRMFGLHFIATKIIENKYNIYYSQILQARIQGDYDDFFLFDEETSKRMLEDGLKFIEEIERKLQ